MKVIMPNKNVIRKDIPKWFSVLVLVILFFYFPVHMYSKLPNFLSSKTAYMDGKHLYTHLNEAIQLKELLRNGTLNFWFSDTALGYPMFMSNEPLPCFATAVIMLLSESYVTNLCVFRWLILLLTAMIPITWYRGARIFMLSRVEGIALAMFSLCIDSVKHTGLELDAYFLHGLYPQLFGMVLLPLTASRIYVSGLRIGTDGSSSPVYLLCLTYLCHKTLGLYCSMLAFCTVLVYLMTKKFRKKYAKNSLKEFTSLHLGVFVYLSGWIIPHILSYPDYGEQPDNKPARVSVAYLLDIYTNGHLFDNKRQAMWFTMATALGCCVITKRLYDIRNSSMTYLNHNQIFSTWLLLITLFSSFLYLSDVPVKSINWMIPSDFKKDGCILGLHFCGLLLAAMSTGSVINTLLWLVEDDQLRKMTRIFILALFSLAMMKTGGQRLRDRVSLVEISTNIQNTLSWMNQNCTDGRVLVYDQLGTDGADGAWHLENIPHLTSKPGLPKQSLAQGSILSTFYLTKIAAEDSSLEKSATLLELYNVRYIVISAVFFHRISLNIPNLQHIQTVNGIQLYKIDPEKNPYSYFNFVRLPGFIDGDLNNIRETMVEILDLYSQNVLFYLNPSRSDHVRENGLVNVQVVGFPYYHQERPTSDVPLVTWKLCDQNINSEKAMRYLHGLYSTEPIASEVVEERRYATEYHALVNIQHKHVENKQAESLLLKVSYHLFWRCFYFPVDENYTLIKYDKKNRPRRHSLVTVHHVTPNLMSVTLPAGKYHVIFSYRYPGILKLLSIICACVFINKILCLRLEKSVFSIFTYIWKGISTFAHIFTNAGIFDTSMFFKVQDLLFPKPVKEFFSFVTSPVLLIRKHSLLRLTMCAESLKKMNTVRDFTLLFLKRKQNHDNFAHAHKSMINQKEGGSLFTSETDIVKNSPDSIDDKSADLNSSYASDNVFTDNKFGKVSPPTPPKHVKKSYRKRHAKISNNEEDSSVETAGSSHAPILETIFKSLRRNLLPQKQNTLEFAISDHKETSIPSATNVSSSATKHDKTPLEEETSNFQKIALGFGLRGERMLAPKDELFAMFGNTVTQHKEGIENIRAKCIENEINLEDNSMTAFASADMEAETDLHHSMDLSFDQSFSSERSSSPDLSHSSPERFISSPDESISPDSSFEYTSNAINTSSPVKSRESGKEEGSIIQCDLNKMYTVSKNHSPLRHIVTSSDHINSAPKLNRPMWSEHYGLEEEGGSVY